MYVHPLIHFNKMQSCFQLESFGKIKTIKYAPPCGFLVLFFNATRPRTALISVCSICSSFSGSNISSIVSSKFNVTRALSRNYLCCVCTVYTWNWNCSCTFYCVHDSLICAGAVNSIMASVQWTAHKRKAICDWLGNGNLAGGVS